MRLWDVETGKELRVFKGHTHWVACVAFSPDGKTALSAGCQDRTVRLWDVESGKELKRFAGHRDDVFSVAFSPDGKQAYSAGKDHMVRVWDLPRKEAKGADPK
jgi:WD40 repeat protein